MSKLLGGLFIGIFGGVFAYEVAKRTMPEMTAGLAKGVEGLSDLLAAAITASPRKATPKKRRQQIPVE